jgi:hypothetical protein
VLFKIEDYFVDDYQHYPKEEYRLKPKNSAEMLVLYSLCELDKYWSDMLVEDKQVMI